jgi:homopolymeric O-antigen transport system ATP-binding protein
MATTIEAVHLSKKFKLGAARSREDSFREALIHGLRASWQAVRRGWGDGGNSSGPEWMWALHDVNFRVEQGDVIGIIGANGAGKSTLLKILSRITDPTEGYVRLRGRVASLLEVGTGFHPDLTGRENVFMNGAMLGMTKAEIESKFDEIVAFAELEKFLDTPVKHYSSGMYVRLGFAVAAHLDPEVLIVDEVLAVGDISFQKKCLGKMGQFGQNGRTILFVSHNIPAVLNLCRRGIVLEQGRLTFAGDAKSAVEYYVGATSRSEDRSDSHIIDLWNSPRRLPQYEPWLRKLEVFSGDGKPFAGELATAESIRVHVEFQLREPIVNFDVRVNFTDVYGQMIFAARSTYERKRDWGLRSGVQEVVCEIPTLPLTPGEYRIEVGLVLDDKCVDYVEDAHRLKVLGSDFYGTGKIPSLGFFVHDQHWLLK